MVNENYFRFDPKSFFEIKLFVFAHTFDIRVLESGNDRSSESSGTEVRLHPTAGIRQNPATFARCQRKLAGIRPWSEVSRIDLAKMARIRPDLDGPAIDPAGFCQNGLNPVGSDRTWRNPAKHVCRNPATATERCQIPATVTFSSLVIFS
jgi:hypothetical protein